MTVAYTLSVTQSPKATYLNGGFDADARQYRLRSTQHTPNGPRIDAAIAGASPGDFETVWSDVSGDLLRVQRASTGALAQILDWTPHAVFHQATQQLFIGGFRYNYKFIAYSDVRGEWRELHMPGPFGRLGGPTNTVHFYGNICQDESGNVYFSSTDSVAQTWRLAPVAEQWTQVANTPSLSQVGSAIEWFPEANSGSGGLIKTLDFGSTTCRVILLNAAETSWSTLASGVPNGQHALPRHHPSHARVLIVGGTNTQNAATLLEANGTATAVTVVPGNLTMSGGSWCIAHPAGCWLVRTEGVSGRVYAAWPNATYDDLTWQDLGAAPDAALTNPTVAVDTARGTYGTAFITAESGLYAWALPAVTDPSAGITSSLAAAGGSGTLEASTVVAPLVVLAATGGSGSLSAVGAVSPLAVFTATGGSGALSAESTVASPGTVSSSFAGTGGSGALAAEASVSPVVVAALSGSSGTLSAVSAALSTFVMPEAANLVREPSELRWVREPAETRFIAR